MTKPTFETLLVCGTISTMVGAGVGIVALVETKPEPAPPAEVCTGLVLSANQLVEVRCQDGRVVQFRSYKYGLNRRETPPEK